MKDLNGFIGLTLKEAVIKVRSNKDFVTEFAVATKKNSLIIERVEDVVYNVISNAKGLNEYMIETNAEQRKVIRRKLGVKNEENAYFKTEIGYHKIIRTNDVETGFNTILGDKETISTFTRKSL